MMARHRMRRPVEPAMVSTRSDWRGLIKLARDCASDAANATEDADAALRLMTLTRRCNRASTTLLDRDAGATVADTARAFLKLLDVFTRLSTASANRVALAPLVDGVAAFLDDLLHELASNEFQRAHEGRPEVWR